MKKLLCLLMIGAMALTILAGCGAKNAPAVSPSDTSNTQSPPPNAPADTSPTTLLDFSGLEIAAAGENQDVDGVLPYVNEVYNYAVNIPDTFILAEEREEGAVFLTGDGARIEVLGDWADVGGFEAISNAYNASCALPGHEVLDSFFEQELGFGVFHIAVDTTDYPEGQAAYILGAQNGRSIVLVTLTYPPEMHYAYLPIAERLTEELTTLVIPDNVIAAADEGIIAAS